MSHKQQHSIGQVLTWGFPAFVALVVFFVYREEASVLERVSYAFIIGGATWFFAYIFYLTCRWIAAVFRKNDEE